MRLLNHILSLLMVILCCGCTAKPSGPAFEYRALATPSNVHPEEFSLDSTNNVDNDWALWGHNLWKVVGKEAPEEVYALIDGKRDSTQFCFSSQKLYGIINEWIPDQWGTEGGRFTIMPADNKKVCQCDECLAAGNTAQNATPAVSRLVTRLATRYPRHQFFMTAYHTTLEPPSKALPANVGVMLSTMSIPMRYDFYQNKGYREFDALADKWKTVTPLLYVWEYARNFDDYLTPYPCLYILQKRFQYYQRKGIKGVFINGSSYDYSTFDDLQSHVIAKLLVDPSANVDDIVEAFYKTYYPETGSIIANYYMYLERYMAETNHILPYYGTMAEIRESYLDAKEFINFWNALDARNKTVQGKERKYVSHMLTAMTWTRLHLPISDDDRYEMLLILKEHNLVPGLNNYKETNGSIDEYLKGKIK